MADSGQAEEGIAHFREALQLSHDYAEAHINLGRALARSGQVEEASAHYRKAQELDPGSMEAYIKNSGQYRQAGEKNGR